MNFSIPQYIVLSGFGLMLLELLVGFEVGFDLVLIGSILIISGLVGEATGSLTLTLVMVSVLTVLYIFFGRKIVKQKITVLTHKTNIDKLIGKTGFTLSTIEPEHPGRVKVDDEEWRATADVKIDSKEKVVVEALEGVTLKVRRK